MDSKKDKTYLSAFSSLDEFVDTLNRIEREKQKNIFNDLKYICNPFDLNDIHSIIKEIDKGRQYVSLHIPKKSGASREISVPSLHLKKIQRNLKTILEEIYRPPSCATGFVCGRSVLNNAEVHIGRKYIFNIDIAEFFHSIDRSRVKKELRAILEQYFESQNSHLIYIDEFSDMLAKLTTKRIIKKTIKKPLGINNGVSFVLPQGAPTSPIISNIVCRNLDEQLSKLARSYSLDYTRYADDITFSGNNNVFKSASKFRTVLTEVLGREGFNIVPEKTRLLSRGERQVVTGLVVSEKVNVPRRYIREVRMLLYFWEKYGYNKASELYGYYYRVEKGAALTRLIDLKSMLYGKLNYMTMVRGKSDLLCKKLWDRYFILKDRVIISDL
jgi:retron-type reverse transcriptase